MRRSLAIGGSLTRADTERLLDTCASLRAEQAAIARIVAELGPSFPPGARSPQRTGADRRGGAVRCSVKGTHRTFSPGDRPTLALVDAFAERGAILAEAWQWWATTLTELDAVAWQRETRLPGWDVAALSAHASLLVRGLSVLSSQPLDTEPAVRSACDMLRGFNTPGGVATTIADAIAEMARRHAASMQPHGLVAAFTVTAPQVIASLEGSGPIVIEYFGNGTFPIAEAMSIAVLEAVVHGLDLCAAVDWPASSIPPSPMHHTVGLLASMTEPVSFIEAATGRTSTPVLPVLC